MGMYCTAIVTFENGTTQQSKLNNISARITLADLFDGVYQDHALAESPVKSVEITNVRIASRQTYKEYLEGLLPDGYDDGDRMKTDFAEFETEARRVSENCYIWRECLSDDTRILFLKGALKGLGIHFDDRGAKSK